MSFVETGRFIETKAGGQIAVRLHASDETLIVLSVEDSDAFVHLTPEEARAIAQALLYYAERLEPPIKIPDDVEFGEDE